MSAARPASATRPVVNPSRSSSVRTPSPLGASSFMRVNNRHRFRYPSGDSTSTGRRQRPLRLDATASRSPRPGWGPAGQAGPQPLAIVSSQPIIGLMPAASAALWNRGAPYTPSRSSRASAEYPSSAARSTRASGKEAPSRKENADDAWSSTYSDIYTHTLSLSAVARREHGERRRISPPFLPGTIGRLGGRGKFGTHRRRPTRHPTRLGPRARHQEMARRLGPLKHRSTSAPRYAKDRPSAQPHRRTPVAP